MKRTTILLTMLLAMAFIVTALAGCTGKDKDDALAQIDAAKAGVANIEAALPAIYIALDVICEDTTAMWCYKEYPQLKLDMSDALDVVYTVLSRAERMIEAGEDVGIFVPEIVGAVADAVAIFLKIKAIVDKYK